MADEDFLEALKKRVIPSGDSELDKQIQNWIAWDRNKATLQQVLIAVSEREWEALRIRLCNRIPFGSSGLRAGMRAGFDSMNDLVVVQTTQGLCKCLMDTYPSVQKRETQGVVIGYDGRYNSKRYAELSAAVFLNNNFKVYLFTRIVPTPFVPFTILLKKCLAGVMITASRNPKEDNGYKIFWTNGAKLIPPIDQKVHDDILSSLEPKASSWDLSILDESTLLIDPYRDIYPAYYSAQKKMIPPCCLETNECSQLRFVYTAMHGVGYPYIREVFYQAKLKPVIAVPQQRNADPEFPTVSSPDPEEGASALQLSKRLACEEHVSTILANDPDADRLAVAEMNPKRKWKLFTGNELGALLGWWALENYKMREPNHDVSNCVMIGTIISSKILSAMARQEGFVYVETLAGFKWIGNKAMELEALGRTVLFAFEEAIGFMFSTIVPDKDGISAAAHLATMACHLRTTRHITLDEKLYEIYDRYGYHANICSHLTCQNPDIIAQIFERLRNFEELPGTYPKCILDGLYEIMQVRDLTTGLDTTYADRKARLPVNPMSQLITFTFTNGLIITFRAAGTDLKIKYNAEIFGLPEEKEWEEIKDKLLVMVDACIDEFLQPEVNGLTKS